METDDGAENRFAKIQAIVEQCRYGIHDLSRTESDGNPPLPRFNMPLELGLFIGARRYGDEEQKRKSVLILDVEQYRYQRFISDIAGQDIRAHGGEPARAIEAVATWLRIQSRSTTGRTADSRRIRAIPGETARNPGGTTVAHRRDGLWRLCGNCYGLDHRAVGWPT
jgi:hypothetical protein